MDTDDLSALAWGIIAGAALVSNTLKAELGAMASAFRGEDEWLRAVRDHLVRIVEDPDEYVDAWDLENTEAVTAAMIGGIATTLRDQTDRVLSAPMSMRGPRS